MKENIFDKGQKSRKPKNCCQKINVKYDKDYVFKSIL